MSKLEVDKIDPQSGTDLELGSSGDTITIPTGVTLDASNATTTLPANVVTTDGSQTLTNKSIAATQLTGTVATSNLGTGTADSTTFLRGDQTYASATPAADSITTSQLAYNPNQYRNIIINGDMSIAQRGTSFTSLSSGSNYTLDRFGCNIGTAGTWTVTQDTDVPSSQGFAKSLKLDCTTANASLSAGSYLQLFTKFEGQNLQYLKKGTANAESLTLSFWVKSNKTGTYNVELDDNDNTRNINYSYTINLANTWEKKTITFNGDTSGAFGNDNGDSLRIFWWLSAGTDFSSGTLQTSWGSTVNANRAVGQVNLADSTANEWYITGVQLEAGTSASDFEFLPYDINLMRCERYFKFSMLVNGYGGAPIARASGVIGATEFSVPIQGQVMRASPTATVESPGTPDLRGITTLGSGTGSAFDGGNLTLNTIVTSKMTGKIVRVRGGAAGAYADGTGLAIFNNGSEFNAKLDAEL